MMPRATQSGGTNFRVLGCHTRCFPSLNSFRHLVKSLLGPLGKDLDLLDAVLHPFFVFVDRYLEC